MKCCFYSFILILLLLPCFLYGEDTRSISLILRSGASIPLSDMGERTEIYLPYFSAAVRLLSPYSQSKYLFFELESGFFAYRAVNDVAGKRAVIYGVPVFVYAAAHIRIYQGLYFSPSFGPGMIFNIVKDSSSSGAYNHFACSAGVEFSYRFNDYIGIHLRTRAVFGFDKNRVLYHIVPDAGVSVYF